MTLLAWLVAFLSMCALDVVWVLYMRASNKNEPGRAAVWAAAIHGFGAVAAISYIGDHRLLSATMLGTVVGTYGVVWWNRRRDAGA